MTVKPAGTDPESEPPRASNDQPETIRAPVGRGHDTALATASSQADASSETAAKTEVKASPADTPSLASAPANPESKASASTFASVLASQSPGATAAATKPASVQGKGDTGTAASPAAQIAPAIISLATNASGTQRLTVRLEPEALGRVQIQIEQPVQGVAHVTVTVDRPETLNLLLRDQPQLQHALDQAGVPSEGRAVTFHVAPAESTFGTNQHAASGGSGGGMQANAEGSQREQKSGGSRGEDHEPLTPIEPAQTFSVRQMRLGVDITA
jgi:flagellar hook-length control protein FliK